MMSFLRSLAWGLCVACAMGSVVADDAPKPAAATSSAEMNDEEKAFAELLTGVDLVGSFTVDGQTGSPKQDRYSITKAVKVKGNSWVIHSRIKYGEVDLTVPVPVKIDWAGKTPVLSVADLKIPGLGSEFGSSLLFQGNRYAGTWEHGKVGGHMWGRIEKTPAKAP